MRRYLSPRQRLTGVAASISLLLLCPIMSWAQTPAVVANVPGMDNLSEPTAIGSDFLSADDLLSIADSSVGYIDSAIPATQIRLRYDTAYNNTRPTRSEFLWAWSQPIGPGWPLPERRVDDQVGSLYFEYAPVPRLSGFVEAALGWVNPEVNANDSGIGDMQFGAKYAVVYSDDMVITTQMRIFAPTGYSQEGLGVGHPSIEPALLGYFRLTEKWTAEAEARYWQPLNGTTDRAGPVTRYGAGLSYLLVERGDLTLRPIVEMVGWTVISGAAQAVTPAGIATVENSRGDTIVNAKFGARLGWRSHQIYAGYGQALTNDAWYQNILRLEYRWLFGGGRKCQPCADCCY